MKPVKNMETWLAQEDKEQESVVLQEPRKYFSGRIAWLMD